MPIPRRDGAAPRARSILSANVIRNECLSASYRRVTIAGEDLARFEYQGLDQNFRLFFKTPAQESLRLPTVGHMGWMAQFAAMPAASRPVMRGYTVRHFREDAREMDIDFVIHPGGPAAEWATRAQPGEPVGILDEGTIYRIRKDADWQLLVADETGVPSALAILEQTPETLQTLAVLEVPTRADVPDTPTAANVDIVWLTRDGTEAMPGQASREYIQNATLPNGRAGVFLAGESGLVTGLRRHLVNERGYAKKDITFFGYWKHGKAH